VEWVNGDVFSLMRGFLRLAEALGESGWHHISACIVIMRGAVLRLERRVRYERIGVVGFDNLRPFCNVASASPSLRNVRAGAAWRAPRRGARIFAALLAVLPSSHFTCNFCRAFALATAIRNNSDAQSKLSGRFRLNYECMPDARIALISSPFALITRPAKTGTSQHGPKHACTVNRFRKAACRQDRGVIHLWRGLP